MPHPEFRIQRSPQACKVATPAVKVSRPLAQTRTNHDAIICHCLSPRIKLSVRICIHTWKYLQAQSHYTEIERRKKCRAWSRYCKTCGRNEFSNLQCVAVAPWATMACYYILIIPITGASLRFLCCWGSNQQQDKNCRQLRKQQTCLVEKWAAGPSGSMFVDQMVDIED